MSEPRERAASESPSVSVVGLRWYLCVLAFVGPLRFGSVIVSGEIAQVPASFAEWIVGNWPPFVLGALAGIGLIWASAVCWRPVRAHPAASVLWVWASLPAVCLISLLATTEWDAAVTFLLYLVGVVAFLLACMKLSLHDESFPRCLLVSVAAATFLCGLIGWHQRLWGFEEMRRFAEMQAAQSGEALSAAMQGKLLQTRVHRPFFLPNSYAAHLALTGPLTLLLLWRAGQRVAPVNVSRWLFLGAGAVIVFGAFLLSGSRGAQLALGAGLGVGVLSLKQLRRWRWPLLAAGVLTGVVLTVVVNQGRDLLSASARVQYYVTALRMAAEHPFTGVGLGEFFPHYLKLKPFGAEETRAAHNMLLSMLSQVGLLGGLAAAACLALPAWIALFQRQDGRVRDPMLVFAILAGVGAWSAHSLLDFNIEIPPTVMTAAVLPLFCYRRPDLSGSNAVQPEGWRRRALSAFVGLLALAALWRYPGERRYRHLSDHAQSMSFQQLTEWTEKTASLLPLSPYPWVIHGRWAMAMGRPSAASKSYGHAVRCSPHRAAFHLRQAEALLLLGDWSAARQAAETAWEWYPGNARIMTVVALLRLVDAEMPDSEARRWAGSVLAVRPELRVSDGEGQTLTVELAFPESEVMGGVSPEAMASRFDDMGLRTPLRGVVVRFAAVQR